MTVVARVAGAAGGHVAVLTCGGRPKFVAKPANLMIREGIETGRERSMTLLTGDALAFVVAPMFEVDGVGVIL